MADNELTTIKPIQGLPVAGGVTARHDREERRKRHDSDDGEDIERSVDETAPAASIEDDLDRQTVTDDPDEHIIDYCA